MDLGPSSIGWALINEQNGNVIATGVRVFPEGVDRDNQGGEKSKSQTRREKRMIRRQVKRRARRLRILRQALTEAGLLPATEAEQNAILAVNPYTLRLRALDQRLVPFEIGRIFYHLAKRRGFLSNRKTDRAKESDTQGLLLQIADLAREISESECRTLGEYLARLDAADQKVRGRHTRRDMYLHEFETIWEKQRQFHADLLTEPAKFGSIGPQVYPEDPDRQRARATETHLQRYGLHGIMFFQRRVYWPASIVGRCELEPKHKRCPRADRLAQRFRILQEVNNLRYRDSLSSDDEKLTDEQRQDLIDYLSTGKERKFENIRKRLMKKGLPATARFNFERGERDKLKGHETDAVLGSKKCLGKEWQAFTDERRDRIVALLIDPRISDEETINELVESAGLTPEQAEAAFGAKLPDGHSKLSREAMKKLLPYLEQGFHLLGKDETDSALHAAGYFRPVEHNGHAELGPVPSTITNPLVRQALFETRKVVNAVIREYGLPGTIRVELAREAKKSFAERLEILRDNRNRERERAAAADRLVELGIPQPKRKDILKYQLWCEADHICVYCGQGIGAEQLKNGEANVDHILPRWRSLDDSYMNKVLCHRHCNEEKSDRTPREWLEDADPARYQAVLARARALPYPKLCRFTQRDLELDEFVNRHLTDTAFISRQVRDYLRALGVEVACSRGTITAELRRFWGLNTILYPEGQGEKTRADHRHHAVDAAVVALAIPKRLHRLAQVRGDEKDRRVDPPWPGFRDDLAEAIQAIQVSHKPRRRICGSLHKDTHYGPTQKRAEDRRVPLEDRPWARDWREGEKLYVCRRLIAEINNTKQLQEVRDRAIRDYLVNNLRAKGVDPAANDYKAAFQREPYPTMPDGRPIYKVRCIVESNTFQPVGERRKFQFVQPGNNHSISYYESTDKKGDRKWQARVTTMWDAALRVRQHKLPAVNTADIFVSPEFKPQSKLPPVSQGNMWHAVKIKRDDNSVPVEYVEWKRWRFIMSLSIGESFLISTDAGTEQLCVVHKIKQDQRLYYKLSTDARRDKDRKELCFTPEGMRKHDASKITVDSLGRIRNSKD
ncbi:type II CRISPR RNA-guided endonuclease Cas9 [bacterium]|nr:type II CRISPR RNA-guided endonuclease Cas9 [bacterium]